MHVVCAESHGELYILCIVKYNQVCSHSTNYNNTVIIIKQWNKYECQSFDLSRTPETNRIELSIQISVVAPGESVLDFLVSYHLDTKHKS